MAAIEIDSMIQAAKAAQKVFETYTQEQVDAVVKVVGKAIYDNARVLAEEAVEESGLGNVESKIGKQQGAAMRHWMYLKGKKSMGIIEEDLENNVVTYAKPIGVIASITPSTNPTSTLCGNAMSALKARNAVICAPHPRAKKVTSHGAFLMREALAKIGAPIDLIQVIEEPTLPLTGELMHKADSTIATGGEGMVRAAYSSGKPAFGVGAGNVQVIVDKGYEGDLNQMAADTIANRNRDYGIPCVSEQCIHVHRSDLARLQEAFRANGAYLIVDDEMKQKLRERLFNVEQGFNVDAVGKPATELAKSIGLDVPEDTKILMTMVENTAEKEVLCKEKLSPICVCLPYDEFDEAVEHALKNLSIQGAGHSSAIYSNNEEHIHQVSLKLPVSRVLVNCSTKNAGGGAFNIGYVPTVSLGCGFWGGNSSNDNLNYLNLMQKTRVARIIPDAHIPTPEEVWAD